MNYLLRILPLVFSILLSSTASGGTLLSPLALLNRCHGQLTGVRPPLNDPRTLAVKNGTLDPIVACKEILDAAVLSGGGGTTVADSNNPMQKNVLRTLHQVHSSWMAQNDFATIENFYSYLGTVNIWDPSSPALYFTRAALAVNPSLRGALTGSSLIVPYRTDNNPSVGADAAKKTEMGFESAFTLASRGELLGIQQIPALNGIIRNFSGYAEYEFPAAIQGNAGGGLIGNYTYLSMNTRLVPSFRSDGAVQVPRRWARSVFQDLLCRNMPSVRQGDGAEFLVTGPGATFRQSSACIHCHASMDRMAGVVRNIRSVAATGANQAYGVDTVRFLSPTAAPELSWPATSDSDYDKRPPMGTLFFRNYKGDLISTSVNGVEALAQEILQQDDFYICAAKRYYEYFTGIGVFIGDIGDPSSPKLSAADISRRDLVIQLGLSLKKTDNLRQLIKDILSLDHYKLSDFGLN